LLTKVQFHKNLFESLSDKVCDVFVAWNTANGAKISSIENVYKYNLHLEVCVEIEVED
jgi:hypothetical protein